MKQDNHITNVHNQSFDDKSFPLLWPEKKTME